MNTNPMNTFDEQRWIDEGRKHLVAATGLNLSGISIQGIAMHSSDSVMKPSHTDAAAATDECYWEQSAQAVIDRLLANPRALAAHFLRTAAADELATQAGELLDPRIGKAGEIVKAHAIDKLMAA